MSEFRLFIYSCWDGVDVSCGLESFAKEILSKSVPTTVLGGLLFSYQSLSLFSFFPLSLFKQTPKFRLFGKLLLIIDCNVGTL